MASSTMERAISLRSRERFLSGQASPPPHAFGRVDRIFFIVMLLLKLASAGVIWWVVFFGDVTWFERIFPAAFGCYLVWNIIRSWRLYQEMTQPATSN